MNNGFAVEPGTPIGDQRRFGVNCPGGGPQLGRAFDTFVEATDLANTLNQRDGIGPRDGTVQTTLPLFKKGHL